MGGWAAIPRPSKPAHFPILSFFGWAGWAGWADGRPDHPNPHFSLPSYDQMGGQMGGTRSLPGSEIITLLNYMLL